MIKKIQIELSLFTLLLISVLLSYKIDIEIFSFFSKLNYGYESFRLKSFFISITDLGDSLWYFLFFFLVFTFSYFAKSIGLIKLEKYLYLKKFSFFGFTYLLFVGIITQLIKHIVGRPRPNYYQPGDDFGFNFFTTESAFHSFPSGHSSTIIAISIILSITLPSLKYFFYICGFLIALSRVVVGAHFVSDVVGGTIVAIMVYRFFDFYIKKKYSNIYWNNLEIYNVSILTKKMVVFLILGVFCSVGPDIDIFISGIFYYDTNQFLVQSYYLISILLRKVLLPFLLIYIFILPFVSRFLPIKSIYFNYKFSLSEIFFIWASGALTLILFVNVLLKNMWGRARPNDVSVFGGIENFTPWYKISNSCSLNCSFVSGDASVGFFIIVFYFITNKKIFLYSGLFLGCLLGIIRIAAGGHFFSDIIFSNIVVTTSISMLFVLYKKLYDK